MSEKCCDIRISKEPKPNTAKKRRQLNRTRVVSTDRRASSTSWLSRLEQLRHRHAHERLKLIAEVRSRTARSTKSAPRLGGWLGRGGKPLETKIAAILRPFGCSQRERRDR